MLTRFCLKRSAGTYWPISRFLLASFAPNHIVCIFVSVCAQRGIIYRQETLSVLALALEGSPRLLEVHGLTYSHYYLSAFCGFSVALSNIREASIDHI